MSVITFSKDKRAISIMIGYILLITSAVVMSSIVYQWMKSYVPKDTIDCPDGVSLYIVNSSCEIQPNGNYEIRISLRNNGRFDVGGYFIHATDSQNQTLATVDLSKNFVHGGQVSNNAIVFIEKTEEVSNYLNPNDDIDGVFNSTKKLYSLEIIPIRYQVLDNKKQLVSCGDARIVEKINCDAVVQQQCIPNCSGKECGDDGCGGTCTFCSGNNVCVSGSCVPTCQNNNQCSGGKFCVNNVCQLCGNGVVDSGEECDSVAGCGEDCMALDGYICNSVTNTCDS
jgi:hypothetical protein